MTFAGHPGREWQNLKDQLARTNEMTPHTSGSDSDRADHNRDEKRTEFLLLFAVLAGIAAVAYADSLVLTISLGYLYVLPLSLAALVFPLPITMTLVGICVVLHDWLGPFVHSGWQMLYRNVLTLLGFTTVVLLVHSLAEQRRRLTRQVHAQRDELAAELRRAAEIQQRLLPHEAPNIYGFEFAGMMSPAKQLGGDYYDYIQLPEGNVGLVIADVSGKGTEAALFMPSIEVALRMDASAPRGTGEVLTTLNRVLLELASQTRYVTIFYAKLDPSGRTLQYTNAGHPPPLIVRASDDIMRLSEGGPIVGMLPDIDFGMSSVRLQPGDIVVFYTDGVVEAQNPDGEFYSAERLVSAVRANRAMAAQGLVSAIHRSVVAFASSEELQDDFTLMVMKVGPE
jgi:serine phosphatase RsbU (regulator of sigma subunit)